VKKDALLGGRDASVDGLVPPKLGEDTADASVDASVVGRDALLDGRDALLGGRDALLGGRDTSVASFVSTGARKRNAPDEERVSPRRESVFGRFGGVGCGADGRRRRSNVCSSVGRRTSGSQERPFVQVDRPAVGVRKAGAARRSRWRTLG
jgi:hypothetical protein